MSIARAALLALTFAVTACGPKTALLSDRPAQDDDTYFFATLSKRKARKVERLLPPHGLVSRQSDDERTWIYVINDPGVGGIPRFDFQQLTKCEINVRLERLSDIQGLGVNAGNVKRQESFTREFKAANMHEAVTLLQALALDPFEAAKKHAPEQWKTVAEATQIDSLEQGFAIAAHAELVTGNPLDPASRMTLYTLEATSPRQAVSAKVE